MDDEHKGVCVCRGRLDRICLLVVALRIITVTHHAALAQDAANAELGVKGRQEHYSKRPCGEGTWNALSVSLRSFIPSAVAVLA